MESRLGLLEARVGELTESIRALQARIAVLESAAASPAEESTEETLFARRPGADQGSRDPVLPLLGRASLIFGVAFLLRMLTESDKLPPAMGVFLGLAYAALWLGVAGRAASRGTKLGSAVLGVTGLAIACPLLWEAATKFRTFDATTGLLLLALFAAATLAIAAGRTVPALAWAATLLPATTAFAFVPSAGALLPATAFLVALGIATDRLAESRAGSVVRWPAAAAADLACGVLLVIAARPGGAVGPYQGLSLSASRSVILLLPAGYLASFAVRILLAKRPPAIFEGLQTLLVLLIGAAGARLIQPPGASNAVLLALAGAAAVGAYVAAVQESGDSPPRRFGYFSSTALAIFLLFFPGLLSRPLAALLWSALALATAAAATRWRRPALAVHSTVYLSAAAISSGLAGWLWTISMASPLPPGALAIVAALCGAVTYAVMAGQEPRDRRVQIGAALGASLALLTLGGGLVFLAAIALDIGSRPVTLAILRSGVLALMTVGLAAVAARLKRQEIIWIAWALLAVGAVKILVQDVPSGRPGVIALSLVFYGLSLTLAPQFLRPSAVPTP